jgi:thioredoxin reductase
MSTERVKEIVRAFARSADRVRRTGLHGVELLGSHGYLISQFWSPETNLRTDRYGGSFENRMRFATEVIQAVRQTVGTDLTIGIRLSIDEKDGLGLADMIPVVQYLEGLGMLDYLNVVLGTSRTYYGSSYIVPPLTVPISELHDAWRALRQAVKLPILAASRHRRPEEAEAALAEGLIDVVGMTRALISDPHLPNKAKAGRTDEILTCIGCNQSCIGRYQRGLSLQCLQNPVTGREAEYADLPRALQPKRVLVVGGGPGGLQAAATAAHRGHQVILVERDLATGGAARLAQGIPGKEFALLAENLHRQAVLAGVEIRLKTEADEALVREIAPDAVIVAVGADALKAHRAGHAQPHVMTARAVLAGETLPGRRVLVADWGRGWEGLDAALIMAEKGCNVELVTASYCLGQDVQPSIRNKYLEQFYQGGVKLTPHFRLAGVENDTVRLQNIFTLGFETRHEVDAVVLSLGGVARTTLWEALQGLGADLHRVGDCLSPRGAEEAVWEGFQAGLAV